MSQPRKKKFKRSRVPMAERLVSGVLLLGLAGIAVAIAVKGRHYDPHRFALDPAALAATRSAQSSPAPAAAEGAPAEGHSQPAPGMGEGGGETGSGAASAPAVDGAAAPAAASAGDEMPPPAAGLTPQGPTETYDPDSLYKKIDGQAEGYLSFQFKRLRCRSFTLAGGGYLDVYEYDMGEPINAYGIYALERDVKAPQVDFASDGYRSEQGFFLRQGKFYVQVIASDQKPAVLAAAGLAARGVAQRLPVDDAGLEGRKLLPSEGMDAKSLNFTLSDGFGIAGLNNAFQADYAYEGKKLTFFVARQPSPAAAEKAFAEARKVALQFGKVTDEKPVNGAKVFSAESFGQWKVLYLRGDQVGGVVDTDQPELARKYVAARLNDAGAK